MKGLLCLALLLACSCRQDLSPPLSAPMPSLFRPEGGSQADYIVRCDGCGKVWECNTPKPLDSCPSCPPDLSNLCPQIGDLILVLATNMESARHDPDNPVYQREITKAMALLEKHFSECDRCREAFDNWEPGK